MAEERNATFTDRNTVVWAPVFTVSALIRLCRSGGLTLGQLMDMSINLAALIEAVWFACEKQARERKLETQEEFFDYIGTECLQDAMTATLEALKAAFPKFQSMLGGAGSKAKTPLETGN